MENSLPKGTLTKEERTLDFTDAPAPFNVPPFKGMKYEVNGFTVETFETIDELNNGATTGETQPYCFGVDF